MSKELEEGQIINHKLGLKMVVLEIRPLEVVVRYITGNGSLETNTVEWCEIE